MNNTWRRRHSGGPANNKRRVAGQHEENHRQREILIVQGAHAGAPEVGFIAGQAGAQGLSRRFCAGTMTWAILAVIIVARCAPISG